jgi:DNA-binding MarR family transcriptional regulator
MNSDIIPLETATLLRRSVTRLMRRMRQDRGLAPGKLGVLSLLFRNGPMTPGALAQAEGVQPQSLTRLLADIEVEGLASRHRDARDGRQSLLELTEAGRTLLAADAAAKSAWLAEAMAARLSPIEQELLRLAAQLIDRLSEVAP